MKNLEAGIELIRTHEELAHFVGPKSDDLVQAGETALGLQFPPTYRDFLLKLGCGDIAGEEFFGIVTEQFTDGVVPNGIWLTLKVRKDTDLPIELIIVSDTGDGGYYVIDTSIRNEDEESPVLEWWPGLDIPRSKIPVVASDFGEFFLRQVSYALEHWEV